MSCNIGVTLETKSKTEFEPNWNLGGSHCVAHYQHVEHLIVKFETKNKKQQQKQKELLKKHCTVHVLVRAQQHTHSLTDQQ